MARWLGIEMAADSVRVALVRRSYRGISLGALREERYDAHLAPEGRPGDVPSATAALRAAALGLRFDGCAVGIDGARTFVRHINLPAAASRELGNVLAFEVEATLPFELDDAVLDHRVQRVVPGLDPPATLPILAGVAYTAEVRQRVELVRAALGVEPARVGMGALPLANVLAHTRSQPESGFVALLELCEAHTELVVLHAGEVRFARTLSRGMQGLPGNAPALARELRQSLSAWRARGGPALTKIHAVGPGRDMQGLPEFLANETGLELVPLPPLALDRSPMVDLDRAAGFAKCLGLSLGLGRRSADLNLRRGSLAMQESYGFLREKAPLLAGLAAAIIVSFGFSIFAELRALSAERAALAEELAAVSGLVLGEETRDPNRVEELLDEAMSGKSDDPMPAMDAYDLLLELSQRVPKDITHDVAELDFNRGNVTIHGIVPSVGDAETIRAKLAEHPCFRDAKISRTSKMPNDQRQKYVLELVVKCDADKDDKGDEGDAGEGKP